jgi:hypothetical protein
MISCREATRLVSLAMDTELPFAGRMRLRLHIFICKGCARFERQLLLIREALRRPGGLSDRADAGADGTLSEEARERILRSLRNA